MRRNLVMLAGFIFASACAHARPDPVGNCNFPAYALDVPDGPVAASASTGARSSAAPQLSPFEQALKQILEKKAAGNGERRKRLLALSGGSQLGAFGAGFMLGMQRRGGGVPDYDVITATSTGALQSTFVFLANRPLPRTPEHYQYPDDIGHGWLDLKKYDSQLEDLAIAFSITKEKTLLKKTGGPLGVAGAAVSGAVGSLEPLRVRLRQFITDDVIAQVATEYQEGDRHLFVSVTNVDDGKGYAINLAQLAGEWSERSDGAGAELLGHCYASALIASSAVPLAAFPETLDIERLEWRSAANGADAWVKVEPRQGPPQEDLYVDGGARFAVFLPRNWSKSNSSANGPKADATVVINEHLFLTEWKVDGERPEKWALDTLALRTAKILENQVRQYSASTVRAYGIANRPFRAAYVTEPPAASETPETHEMGPENKSCADYRKDDVEEGHPLEFHPKYMACILDYGMMRGENLMWNEKTE